MEDLNVKELCKYYLKKIWLVLVITVVGLLIGLYYVNVAKTPIYTSNTTIILTRLDGKNTQITSTDIDTNKKLIENYKEIAKSKTILNSIIENLELLYDYKELYEMVTISNVKNTELINVVVESKNAEEAAKIANELASVFSERIVDFYDMKNVKIVDEAEVAAEASNMNKIIDLVIFTGASFILSIIIIFVFYYFDDKIKNIEEIEKAGYVIIGQIPTKSSNKKGNRSIKTLLKGRR